MLQIRPATDKDFQEIAMLREKLERELYSQFGSAEQLQAAVNQFCSAEYLKSLGGSNGRILLCAKTDGQVVGCGALQIAGETAQISDVYTAEPGQGVGGALVSSLWDIARSAGVGEIQVRVFEADKQARSFWENLGFRVYGQTTPSVAYPAQKLMLMCTQAWPS
jgi:N-acetylglutamate synthase-like GNAT family acetyltransferase